MNTPDILRLTVTPQRRFEERIPAGSRPDQVHLSTSPPPGFSPEDRARISQHPAGTGPWQSVETASGVVGEVSSGAEGMRYKLLIPADLGDPMLLEDDRAFSLATRGQELMTAREGDRLSVGECQIDLDTLSYSRQSHETTLKNNVEWRSSVSEKGFSD